MTEVTVFCAVWHRDPRRHELLCVHRPEEQTEYRVKESLAEMLPNIMKV